jgi:hypothetical protein
MMSVNLFSKYERDEHLESIEPMRTGEFPLPQYEGELQGSRDVNIILMIKEHAPLRVNNIERQLEQMENEMNRLIAEKSILQKLIKVARDG